MTNSKIDSGKNNPAGTYTPANVPSKEKASENVKTRKTDGINSLEVCEYNFVTSLNVLT